MSLSLFPRFGSLFDDFDAAGSMGPIIHMRESDDALFLELELPRYRSHEVELEVQGHHLIIKGKHHSETEHQTYGQFLYGQAPMSEFRRSIYVPPAWDLTKMTHELNYGVLQVRVPRALPPPPPQQIAIAGTEPVHPGAVTTVNKHGMQVTASSTPEEFNSVATMKWPPNIKVDDANDHITYSLTMLPTVGKDHVDLALDGRNLRLGVKHDRKITKKNSRGDVVSNETQSVSYSTNLLVPEGTQAADISTNFVDGHLTINVSKHDNPSQHVPVK